MPNVATDLIDIAERIERDKNCRALTPDEAQVLQAIGFLRQIAPYLFEPSEPKQQSESNSRH